MAAPFDRIAHLVWQIGGRPFAQRGRRWVAASFANEVPEEAPRQETLDASTWPVIELPQLLAATNLLPGRYPGAPVLNVIAPGQLGRWILRRATDLGLSASLIPAMRQPLGDEAGVEEGVLLLRLRSGNERDIPAAFVHSLTQLPYVIVAESFDAAGGQLLVDVRHRLPISPSIIQGMIPVEDTWVLGGPDTGHWLLQRTGNEVDGTALLEAPAIAIAENAPLPAANLPAPIPVQLAARPSNGQRVDAVLLDDRELDWVRPFLVGRPIGELSFLLPGPGVHLLTAPGGLPSALPFGIPLVRTGPGALYIELGQEFTPHLPDAAREASFQLNSDTAVAIVRSGGYRFDTARLTPAWALWVGEAPPVREGISARGEQLLRHISRQILEAETRLTKPRPTRRRPIEQSDRTGLLEQAQRAELAGNLTEAAELLERAGYPGPAGRLYERAARGRGR